MYLYWCTNAYFFLLKTDGDPLNKLRFLLIFVCTLNWSHYLRIWKTASSDETLREIRVLNLEETLILYFVLNQYIDQYYNQFISLIILW